MLGVSRRVSRRIALAGLVTATVLGLAACGPVHSGAAATVGDTRITTNQVQAAASTKLNDPGTQKAAQADPAAMRRGVLSQLIKDDLIARGAKLKGVAVSEADVQHEIATAVQQSGSRQALESAAASQGGIAAADLHDFFYYALLQQRLEQKLTAGQTVPAARISLIQVTQKPLADAALTQAQADPSKFASLAKQFSQGSSASSGGDVGYYPLDAFPEPLKTDLGTKALNTPFEENDGSNYYVFMVTARGATPLSKLTVTQSVQQIEQQALQTYLLSLDKQFAVKVSPRYGVWDSQSLSVVLPTSGGASPLSTPQAKPSASGSQFPLPSASASASG